MVGMGVGVAVGMAVLVGAVVAVGKGIMLGTGVDVSMDAGAQADNIRANEMNKIHVRFIIRDILSTGNVSHRLNCHNLASYRLSRYKILEKLEY
jgi:hypothetical protein